MPEPFPTLVLLARVRRRARRRLLLQACVDAALLLCGVGAAAAAWNRFGAPPLQLDGAAALVAAVAGGAAVAALRVRRGGGLAAAAHWVDEEAGLQDEMLSALWFRRSAPAADPWVQEHLGRADATARSLDPRRLVPWRRPRRAGWLAFAAAVWAIGVTLPGGGVRGGARGVLGGPTDSERRDAGAEVVELAEPQQQRPRALRPPETAGAELREREAERAEAGSAERGEAAERGERSGEPEPGQEGAEPADAAADEEARQGQAQPPQDAAAEGREQAAADPSASPQAAQGDSSEEAAAMLPGGDEVFLQEGGEDIERPQSAQEDLGHATREGGGEETLQGGEPTSLQVQLEREMLAIPEPEDPRREEEPEEQVTRAERSFLRFERLQVRSEFEAGAPLQRQPVPWRARRLVLEYFRALRARDNQRDNDKTKGRQ